MTAEPHLDEGERQGAADGTLDASRQRAVAAHLATCAECAADVARLRRLMSLVRSAPTPTGEGDDLWPGIRSRIESGKVVRLDGVADALTTQRRRRPWIAAIATMIAAALLVAALVEMQQLRTHPNPQSATPVDIAFASVVDSSQAYEAEAQLLLNELEMQRAMLRPNTSAALDRDMQVIDRSIAELKAAIARDPRNIALQRLLAASYREKVELLKRVNNAG